MKITGTNGRYKYALTLRIAAATPVVQNSACRLLEAPVPAGTRNRVLHVHHNNKFWGGYTVFIIIKMINILIYNIPKVVFPNS